jgi:DNA-binding PadR family transcriptional regulator
MFGRHHENGRGRRHGHGCGAMHMAGPEGRGPFGHGPGGGRFGRGHGGPFGGRGPRRFDPGALRLVVLGLIAEEPRHGYDIIKALEAMFEGTYSPSPGAIYPMLQMLEEADLVVSEADGNKRLFRITEAGSAYLAENAAELDRIREQIGHVAGRMGGAAVGEEIRELGGMLRSKLRGGEWSREQVDKVREILKRARREIEDL